MYKPRLCGAQFMEGVFMKEEGNDNDILYRDIVSLFNSYFGDVLDILSARFPHVKGDGSINEHQFICLRSKILRSGNDKIRNGLVDIVRNYYAKKMFNTDIRKISVGQRVKK